jgi:hypothetical protein
MSTAAGHAVAINHAETVNSLANAVYLDPSSLDDSLKTLDSATGGVVATSPNLNDKVGVKSRLVEQGAGQIVKSAALGYIEKTGQVPDWLSDPKYSKYVNVAEIRQFQREAQTQQRLNQAEVRATRAQTDYDNRNDFNTKANALEAATMPQQPGDAPSLPDNYWSQLRDLSKHPGAALEPGRLRAMVTNGEAITERLNKPEPLGPVSHDTTMSLLNDMRAGKITTNDPIYQAYGEGKLNRADFQFLQNEFTQAKTPQGQALDRDRTDFFKRYAPTIDAGLALGEHSALGSQQMYAAEMDARRQEDVLRQQQKDPHAVYDPRSEYFFGKPENLRKYQVTLQQTQDYERRLREGAAPAPATTTPTPAAPKPPAGYPDAQIGVDGKWHVERNGKFFTVVSSPAAPVIPMSR